MNLQALRGNGEAVKNVKIPGETTSLPRCLVRADGAVLPYTAHNAAKAGVRASGDLPETHCAAIRQALAREEAMQAALLAQRRRDDSSHFNDEPAADAGGDEVAAPGGGTPSARRPRTAGK